MKINNIEFAESLDTILDSLKTELGILNIPYLHTIKPTGDDNIMVSCPYHKNGLERRPSAGIKRDTGIFHCFSCGVTQTLPEVVSYCFGYSDAGAYGWNWLLRRFFYLVTDDGEKERRVIKLDFERDNINNTKVEKKTFVTEDELDRFRYYHPYWEKRGITDEDIIELFDLGYDRETKSITFPVRDKEGHCLFVARRNVHTKFFNYPKGVQKPLYGLYELLSVERFKNDKIIVCESMIDCILLWQAGHFAVALNGLGNKLQMKQLEELPCRHLILATDNDEAGDGARDRIKKCVKGKIFSEIIFPKGIKDIGECTSEQVKNILNWEEYI